MKRWHCGLLTEVEDPKADAFIADLIEVCRKHGLSLGHEDSHGAFLVQSMNEERIKWLQEASVDSDGN